MTSSRTRTSVGPGLLALAALLLMPTGLLGSPASATYSIDFYSISAGGSTLQSACYRLSGTVAQTAPGYSSAQTFALIAGYWQPAPLTATDEIFFNGFEGC